ncbi:pyridoxamine 5'-phosphate oxidase family protein [Actinomycetospora lemnae]|uniref:Pyridoxamine 5'-phosphate oxidase family protein n=1 Tax=Actinomycetospora lemnae TaxID=3019891 RepID=A0ABT5SYR1_9PSEU|nr:pyridoxamine 5'-phosphate oxidase family protein [Actinomycetospora sp. DW7H6]MDD7967929.1 pyridoxamine 5'-phosphate oxidase family protein [Actinomycetospora sp. DW7H6]
MTTTEHGLVEPLGPAEGRALLMTAEIGRLAFTDGHGPTVEPFAFALDDAAIVLAVGARSGARAAVGQTVAFEVDEIDVVRRTGWSVVAVGTLHRAGPEVRARPEPWPDTVDDGERALLVLTVERISGRRLRREVRRG